MAARIDCYTDEQKAEIIAHVMAECASGRPVSKILDEDEGMPSRSCFWRWHFEDEELRDKLARAREHAADVYLDEAVKIADTPREGVVETEKHLNVGGEAIPFTEVRREDMLGHRKLQIETRIKAAQMIAPRKYGPKLDLTSGGDKLALSAELEAARRRAAGDEQ